MYDKQYDILLLVEKKLYGNQKYVSTILFRGAWKNKVRSILMLFYNGTLFWITAPRSKTIDCKEENSPFWLKNLKLRIEPLKSKFLWAKFWSKLFQIKKPNLFSLKR